MAWIAALIGAAATYYGQQQQKKNTKKLSDQQNRLYGIQADTAEQLQPYVGDYFRDSRAAYAPALNYYKSVASGDRSKILGAVSPQLRSIGNKYQSLLSASRELNPRGGASAAYNTDLIYREGDEKQALINSERSGGVANLAKMAGLAGDLGSAAAGGSSNAAAGAGGMLNNAWVMQMLQSQNAAQAYGEIGRAIAGMWGQDKNTGARYFGNNQGRG